MKWRSFGVQAAAAAVLISAAGMAGAVGGDRVNVAGTAGDRVNGLAERTYTDEIYDYGVCRGTDDRCYNDWGQGWEEGEEKRVLIYSRTAGPRHDHLGEPLGPGLNPPLGPDNVAQANLKAWLEEQGVTVSWTEDVAQMSRLGNYNAVISLSANRDTFDDTAQTSLKQFVRRGGGFVGIHNAFGAEYSWPYYEGLLGGANFYDHRPNRPGTVETVNKRDVSTEGLPREWGFTDEWYNLVPYPSFVNVLAEVDPVTSTTPERDSGHPGHGKEHPVSWCHYYDGGRSWLTTLGHDVAAWTDAPLEGDIHFKEHVVKGVLSAMGVLEFCEGGR
jgi:type 1 glutamine amidotransferase